MSRRDGPRTRPVVLVADVLATIAALGPIPLRDVPIVFGDQMAAVNSGIAVGDVIIDAGLLQAANSGEAEQALASLSAADRSLLHQRLARLPLPEAQTARQTDLAVPEGQDLALSAFLEHAALRAELHGHPSEALDLWARVERRAPSSATRFDREIRRAELASAAGRFALAAEALRSIDYSALSASDALRMSELLVTALGVASGIETVRAAFQQILAALPLDDPARFVFALKSAGLETHAGERERRLEAALPQVPDGALRFSALSDLLYARVNAGGGLDQAVLAELRRLAPEHPDLQLEDTPDALEALLAHQVDDVATTRRLMPALIGRAAVTGNAGLEDILLVHAASTDVIRGRFANAADRLARSAEIGARPEGSPAAVRARGLLALETGRIEELERVIALPHGSGTEAIGHLTRVGLQGLALARRGEIGPAIRLLEQCLTVSRTLGLAEPGRRFWVDVDLAVAYVRHGDLGRARAVSDSLRSLAERAHRVVPAVQARRIDAWIAAAEGRQAASRALTREFLHAGETVIWMPERARLLVDALEHLDAAADGELRSFITRSGRNVAGTMEDGTARRALETALGKLQHDPSEVLTAAERRVVDSVVRGASNADAARELHLSVRTVETHLHRIFRKLGVRSRSQLIATLHAG